MRAENVVRQKAAVRDVAPNAPFLRGLVTDEASGDGVSGVLVELWGFIDHAPHFIATTISDGSGRFAFEDPPPSSIDRTHGYELRILSSDGRLRHSEHHLLSDEPGSERVQVRVPAEPGVDRELDEGSTDLADASEDEELLGQSPDHEDYEALTPVQRALDHAGLPTAPEELIDVSAEELRLALRSAVEAGVLGAEFLPEVDARVEALCRAAVESVLEAAPHERPAGRGGVIASLDLPSENLREVLAAYQARSMSDASA